MTANRTQAGPALNAPRISIAIATYNGEKFIERQLESIAGQTLTPFEIVITDDGSTDATLQIAEDFSQTVSFPVRIFRNESRLGYADNFFKAASLCKGDVIAFCDQDDIWMENKLITCSGFFANTNVVLVAHSAQTLWESGMLGHRRPYYSRTKILDPRLTDPFDYPLGFAILVRRELLNVLDATSRPEKLFAHDQWFWFLAASIGNIAVVADCLALYRQHQGNTFGAGPRPSLTLRTNYILQTVNYDDLAHSELACSTMLRTAGPHDTALAKRFRAAAERLERRSRFHRLRTDVFKKDASLVRRLAAFCLILFLGGYLPDQSKTRLGLRAGIKDLLLGVFGVANMVRKRSPQYGEVNANCKEL